MAHLSLYRKFRPNTFSEMVRQEHVVRVLKNQIESGAVGHAYLFCGPRGTGKTSVARIFARAVNCEHPRDGSPCGECPTCLALKGGSLDIAEIDAASNNGVNEMRDLRERVQYPPVTGKYKVYIIDEVHMLTDSAFNALLKTLEEPPVHAIFILATTEPHKIPATILSRCMRLDFKLLPQEDLERHLMRVLDEIGKPYEREAVAAIARAGAGSDRDMLSIAEMCIAYSDRLTYEGVSAVLGAADFSETASLCGHLLRCDLAAALETVERVLAEGKSVGVLCRDLLECLNRVAVVKTCRTAEKLLSLPREHYEQISRIAQEADGRAVLRATEILGKTESELKFVSSPRICLETAIMRIAVPATDDSVDALIVRLNALEKKIAEGNFQTESGNKARPAPEERPAPPVTPAPPAPEERPASPVTPAPPAPEERSVPPARPEMEERPAPSARSAPEEGSAPPAPPAAEPQRERTAEFVYGKFMRLLRKSSRNGVLFTMCSDLEAEFEQDALILYTESGTVLRSLGREEHAAVMKEVLAQLGVTRFEVRMRDEKEKPESAADALKRDFKDYPIEIKSR